MSSSWDNNFVKLQVGAAEESYQPEEEVEYFSCGW
jgi:hypothetical protein